MKILAVVQWGWTKAYCIWFGSCCLFFLLQRFSPFSKKL